MATTKEKKAMFLKKMVKTAAKKGENESAAHEADPKDTKNDLFEKKGTPNK